MAAVLGGVAEDEYLDSIEFLDSTSVNGDELEMGWRIAVQSLSTPRYDFATVTVPLWDMPEGEQDMRFCKGGALAR